MKKYTAIIIVSVILITALGAWIRHETKADSGVIDLGSYTSDESGGF